MSTYSLGSGTPTVTKDDGVTLASMPSVGGIVFYDAQGNKLGDTFDFAANASAVTDLVGYGAPSSRYGMDLGMSNSNQASLTGSFTVNVAVPAGTAKIALLSGGTPTVPADGSATGFAVTINGTAATPAATPIPANGPGTASYWTLPTSEGASVALTAPSGVTFDGTTVVPLHFNYVNDAQVGVQVGIAGSQIDADIDAADVVLVQVGTKSSDAGEENDPSTVALPRDQGELAAAACTRAHSENKKCVVYVQAISLAAMNPFHGTGTSADADAIIWTSYNGEWQGGVVPEILYGDVNPSGKLPFTYYHSNDGETLDGSLAETTDYQLTPGGTSPDGAAEQGRTYQYYTGAVDWPFGYGLSYSTFTYSNLKLDKTKVSPNDTINATVDVTNTSNVAGQAVAELYVSSPRAADPLRPNSQLKGYQKVEIPAGQTVTVTIPVDVSDLWFWDTDTSIPSQGRETFDQGQWKLFVGPDSRITDDQTTSFQLEGTLDPSLDEVTADPDGTVLNTKTPGNVIHMNLTATDKDQSFIDLTSPDVQVTYASSDDAVATVDSQGDVKAGTKAGAATITATVIADGQAKTASIPVITYDGAYMTKFQGTKTVLFANQLSFPDKTISLADAEAGVNLAATLVNPDLSMDTTYTIAPMDVNSADATVNSTSGLFKATKAGQVRVTAVAQNGTDTYSAAATITVSDVNTAMLQSVVDTWSGFQAANYTDESAQALTAALASGKALLANVGTATQADVDAAVVAINVAAEALVPLTGSGLAAMTGCQPTITGTVKTGKTVKINGHKAKWTKGVKLSFYWTVAGQKVASTQSLKLKAAWQGKKLQGFVTGTKAGFETTTRHTVKVTIK
jgi:hypothetical protein